MTGREELARRVILQEKLRKEILSVLGGYDLKHTQKAFIAADILRLVAVHEAEVKAAALEEAADPNGAKVVTLCGSTKFKTEINAENQRLTMDGMPPYRDTRGREVMAQPVITVTAHGKTIECTPCSKKHAAYLDAGYLVLSCRKCVLTRHGADIRTVAAANRTETP